MIHEILIIESIIIENLKNREKLSILFDNGIIDETGDYIEMK